MKLGDCKWFHFEGAKAVKVAADFEGYKWCSAILEGVTFQINHMWPRDAYQINVHYYTVRGVAPKEEYTATFWINSTLELAAFLRDKQPT